MSFALTNTWQPSFHRVNVKFNRNNCSNYKYLIPANRKCAERLKRYFISYPYNVTFEKPEDTTNICFDSSLLEFSEFDINSYGGIHLEICEYNPKNLLQEKEKNDNCTNYRLLVKRLYMNNRNELKKFHCIFHNDKNPSASLFVKRREIFYKCFSVKCKNLKCNWKRIYEAITEKQII